MIAALIMAQLTPAKVLWTQSHLAGRCSLLWWQGWNSHYVTNWFSGGISSLGLSEARSPGRGCGWPSSSGCRQTCSWCPWAPPERSELPEPGTGVELGQRQADEPATCAGTSTVTFSAKLILAFRPVPRAVRQAASPRFLAQQPFSWIWHISAADITPELLPTS